MKKIAVFLALCLVVILAGCSTPATSNSVQSGQQEDLMAERLRKIGMPAVHNFFEAGLLKTVFELRDDPQLTTYVYTKNVNGKFVYLGRAIGFGLPYGTQFTNPQKIERSSTNIGYAILPQADPNTLFSPDSAEASWVLMVDPATNEPKVTYWEERVEVLPYKMPRNLVEDWSIPANY